MNIKDMFETTANFHGINDDAALYANDVIQKTFITVNEQGTEAAAVTSKNEFNLINTARLIIP